MQTHQTQRSGDGGFSPRMDLSLEQSEQTAAVDMECAECHEVISNEKAYQIGDQRWHQDCLHCSRCQAVLNRDSKFTRLAGDKMSFICSNCPSYNCTKCGMAIDVKAIVLTNKEAYCKNCFSCVKCHRDIKDLKYARSKVGFFCIDCHEMLLDKRKMLGESRKQIFNEEKAGIFENYEKHRSRSLDSNPNLLIPKRSIRRTVSPLRKAGNDAPVPDTSIENNSTLYKNTNKENINSRSTSASSTTHIKSNSESVIPQFLVQNDTENNEDPLRGHSRDISIDDVLNSTLGHFDSDPEEQKLRRTQPQSVARISEKSPLVDNIEQDNANANNINLSRGTDEEMLLKSPKRHGVIVDSISNSGNKSISILSKARTPKNSVDLTNQPLNSPMAIKPLNEISVSGLAIDFKQTLDPSNFNYQQKLMEPVQHIESSDLRNTSSDEDKVYDIPEAKRTIKSNAMSLPSGSKKVSRSLSLMSKNIVANLKSKTQKLGKHSINNSDSTPSDLDTHSGWGVASMNESFRTPRSNLYPSLKPNVRGNSDSVLYTNVTPNKRNVSEEDSLYAKHSNDDSGNETFTDNTQHFSISIYRTPPLESPSAFGRLISTSDGHHYKKSSLQGIEHILQEEDSFNENKLQAPHSTVEYPTSPTAAFVQKEIVEADLALRRMKLELRELESSKLRVAKEVEALRVNKEILLNDVKILKAQKEGFLPPTSSSEESSLETHSQQNVGITPTKQINHIDSSNLTNSNSKGRFWKMFSSDHSTNNTSPQQSNYSQYSPQLQFQSRQTVGGGGSFSSNTNKYEISSPLLQVPSGSGDALLNQVPNFSNFPKILTNPLPGDILYGSTLVARCSFEGSRIPVILSTCIEYIESSEKSLKTEGIYRKSGSQILIEEIERQFFHVKYKNDISGKLQTLLDQDIHAVASVFKRYLRKLPNPVIVFEIYEPLMKLIRDNDLIVQLPNSNNQIEESKIHLYKQVVISIKNLLTEIPIEHYFLLKRVTEHIYKVSLYSEWNLMTLCNLVLVFTPGLLYDRQGEKDIIDMKSRNYIVEFIVRHNKSIFLL